MFLALGIPGILIGALVLLTIREPQRGCLDRGKDCHTAAPFLETMRFMLRQPSAVHLIIGSSVVALWGWGLMWWTPAFLMRSYGLNVAEAGAMLGPIHLIGGSLAMVGSTWLLSRPWLSSQQRILRLLGVNVALATVVTAVIYSTHSLALTRALFWLYIPSHLCLHRSRLRHPEQPGAAGYAGRVLRHGALHRQPRQSHHRPADGRRSERRVRAPPRRQCRIPATCDALPGADGILGGMALLPVGPPRTR